MNRFKILSVTLAMLLTGYCGVSVAVLIHLHNGREEAVSRYRDLESRCRLLESKRDEIARQLGEKSLDADGLPESVNGALEQLQESLEFRRL
jgi:hypothetical protein